MFFIAATTYFSLQEADCLPAEGRRPLLAGSDALNLMRRSAVFGVLLSVVFVVLVAFPFGDLVGHPHWSRVDWIPFVTRRVRVLDVVANLVLCAPIGVASALAFRRGILISAAIALPSSLAVEWAQVYSHVRFPSMTDVACNVAGAVVAAAVVQRLRDVPPQRGT